MAVLLGPVPAPPDCESEWRSRSLTELIAHISPTYHEPIRARLTAIRELALRASQTPELRESASVARLAHLASALRQTVEAHTWSEEDILFPAIVAAEHPDVMSTRVDRETIGLLLAGVQDEHTHIRSLLADLAAITAAHAATELPTEVVRLRRDVEMVVFLLNEELDLEDGCLWSRALALFADRV
jgi:iron-sulfur cluster repair protein YtfE (RIC family)